MEVVVGGKYKHFKGHEYRVLCIAKDSEDLKDLVIYQNIHNNEIWARPYDMFLSKVDKEKYPDVEEEYRYQYLGE